MNNEIALGNATDGIAETTDDTSESDQPWVSVGLQWLTRRPLRVLDAVSYDAWSLGFVV